MDLQAARISRTRRRCLILTTKHLSTTGFILEKIYSFKQIVDVSIERLEKSCSSYQKCIDGDYIRPPFSNCIQLVWVFFGFFFFGIYVYSIDIKFRINLSKYTSKAVRKKYLTIKIKTWLNWHRTFPKIKRI